MIVKKQVIIGLLFAVALVAAYFGLKKDIVPLQDNWEKAVPFQEVPQGLVSIRSEDCGVCHQAHYAEWKTSTHAHAWTDMQFQAELKKESSPFLCINCHIPLENQQEFLVEGLYDGDIYQPVRKKNPRFDASMQAEGIGCASCHVRDGAIIGTIGSDKAPHKVKKDPKFLNETLCMSCHNANAVVTPELVCTFQTGDEWAASSFHGQKNCISCHMDTLQSPLVFGMPVRTSHLHSFSGSGIPKVKGLVVKSLNGMAFYPSKIKEKIEVTDSIHYQLTLKNEFAGHRLPTGDPERFYLIKLEIMDQSSGKTVFTKTDRIGETWEWYPTAKKIADNNMNPGESRTFQLNYKPKTKGKYVIKSLVTKHRMDAKTAAYNGLTDEYPLFINAFEEELAVEVY